MKYDLVKALEILVRTPQVLQAQLSGLPEEWLHGDEGPGTWTPSQVIGHLIINEQTNFFPRTLLVFSNNTPMMLEPIDMTSHLHKFADHKIDDLLSQFAALRNESVDRLVALKVSSEDLRKTAIHPKVGTVQLSHILSTWVAHDLVHIGQIARVMAKQYKDETGPFIEFLPRLK
jgi:hypothetical protein